MEFLKERCFTALNADELKAGDKVIVGSSLLELKTNVECNRRCGNIVEIGGECSNRRFTVDDVDGRGQTYWELAYLVERKENCTNCHYAYLKDEGIECALHDEPKPTLLYEDAKLNRCRAWGKRAEPKTETENLKTKKEIDMNWNYEGLPEKQEMGTSDHVIVAVEGCPYGQSGYYDFDLQAWFVDGCSEPVNVVAWQKVELPKIELPKIEWHYRPFRDTDELIKVWEQKSGCGHFYDGCLNLPHIWVKRTTDQKDKGVLITGFTTLLGTPAVEICGELHTMDYLAECCEFLDGTPCGVRE